MRMLLGLILFARLEGDAVLVATAALKELPDTLIVDARPLEDYTKEHIPGAIHLDVNTLSETRDGVVNLLKPIDALREALANAGVDPAKHIVVYCGMRNPDELKDAARLFWILEYLGYPRVSVLDGGFARWSLDGLPVESGPPQSNPIAPPDLKPNPDVLATFEEVQHAIKRGTSAVLDLRSHDYFDGKKKADIVKQTGHIPTARCAPAEQFVSAQATLLLPEQLKRVLSQSAGEINGPAITYCNSGRSASVGYLVLRRLGFDNVAMYDGSMAEWTAKGGPVQSEPAARAQN